MGARVGRDCSIDTLMCSAWDLVSIGDETSIGADTQLLGYRVENGMLKLGRVDIGSRCFVGLHSALGLGVKMEDDSRLDDQSLLPDGEVIARGEGRRGSPAIAATVVVPAPELSPRRRHPVLFGAAHIAIMYAMGFAMVPLALGMLALSGLLLWKLGWVWGLVAQIVVVPVDILAYCLYVVVLKRAILARAKPGIYSLESIFYLRKWAVDGLLSASRALMLPVYTTIYLPAWLRLLGAKIGARAELSTVWYLSPEMLNVEEESFFADGCILGGRRVFRGQVELGTNHVGRRSFVGNGALLPMGAGLGDKCLLGVLSAPPVEPKITPDGTEWLGCPAFALPNRQKVGDFQEAVTYRPTRKLYLQRAVIDGLRILIPGYLSLVGFIATLAVTVGLYLQLGLWGALAALPIAGLGLSLLMIGVIVALKVAVMGRFQPVHQPLWSMYIWLNEMVNGAYESIMTPAIKPFLGTPFIAPLLRLMGCKIGRHTFIESTLFSEWDLVEIGDYAALNTGSVIQTHLFEDRVMKSSYARVGDDCSVGNMAVVLYDTHMQQGASLAPLSLLMKGEVLSPFTRWHGIPTIRVK